MSSKSSRGLKRRDQDDDDVSTDEQPGLNTEIWTEPERARTIYGELSAPYVSCRKCGISVYTGDVDQASHRGGCPHAEAEE